MMTHDPADYDRALREEARRRRLQAEAAGTRILSPAAYEATIVRQLEAEGWTPETEDAGAAGGSVITTRCHWCRQTVYEEARCDWCRRPVYEGDLWRCTSPFCRVNFHPPRCDRCGLRMNVKEPGSFWCFCEDEDSRPCPRGCGQWPDVHEPESHDPDLCDKRAACNHDHVGNEGSPFDHGTGAGYGTRCYKCGLEQDPDAAFWFRHPETVRLESERSERLRAEARETHGLPPL